MLQNGGMEVLTNDKRHLGRTKQIVPFFGKFSKASNEISTHINYRESVS